MQTKEIQSVKSIESQTVLSQEDIQRKIYTIRGVQVMLDRDLAPLFQVLTKNLNKAVKRNESRFPEDFMFQLTKEECDCLRFQIGTSNESITQEKNNRGGIRYLPYVFTEEGVAQLAGLLHSDVAVEMSIRITRAFVAMRRFITQNAGLFQRLEQIEKHQIITDGRIDDTNARFEQIFNRLDDGSLKAKTGVFFDGQMFDAFVLVEELIQKATKRIVLIDDYITAALLQRFYKRNCGVTLDCYVKTRCATQNLRDAFAAYNEQYPTEKSTLHTFENSHDRWLIVDDTIYHFGASLKDLGKRWFAVNIVTELSAEDFLVRIQN